MKLLFLERPSAKRGIREEKHTYKDRPRRNNRRKKKNPIKVTIFSIYSNVFLGILIKLMCLKYYLFGRDISFEI